MLSSPPKPSASARLRIDENFVAGRIDDLRPVRDAAHVDAVVGIVRARHKTAAVGEASDRVAAVVLAVVGGALHGRGDQALAGAAIGAAGGYLIGKAVQHDRQRVYSEGYYDGRDDRYAREDDRRYPVGRFTGRGGFVTSPYYPYNRIDVRGIPHGAQTVDPSCDKIFINP